jgi:glucose/arabinose dehydrogenase
MRLLSRAVVILAAAALFACSDQDSPGASTSEAQTPGGTATTAAATATASITVPGVATDTPTPAGPLEIPQIGAIVIAEGLDRPTFVTNAGDGTKRLFVVEKPGRVRVIAADGTLLDEPFLDIEALVQDGGNEQGLLGLAFHPDYATNVRFFVAYTSRDGQNVVDEFHVSESDPDRAAPLDPLEPDVRWVAIDDFAPNHNGGMLAFGPDGYLYVSTGDGGGGGDPRGAGQDLGTLAGKILRLDVDGPTPAPEDNPFVGQSGAQAENWAYGLRNPWRFSFDRGTGDLWIADVGQNAVEEINRQLADSPGGENYGWNVMEGSRCYEPSSGCDTSGKALPIHEYTHAESGGCSVTGGYVYRGAELQGLQGIYVFIDYCAGQLQGLRVEGDTAEAIDLDLELERVTSFGEDEEGELYATLDDGTVVRFALGNSSSQF